MTTQTYPAGTTFEYGSSTWRGHDRFFCYDCPFDIFNEATMIDHCRRNGHGVIVQDMTEESFIEHEAPLPPIGVKITLGYITWNTRGPSVDGVKGLLAEADRLRRLGQVVELVILDNGSSDGTPEVITEMLRDVPGTELIRNVRNFGISVGRNQIIDAALDRKSKYLLMMDGDIQVVPLSTYVMIQYLECHTGLGCIGAASSNYTREPHRASKYLFDIPEISVKSNIPIAWTQYGLFRCRMFELGVRFDEDGPFGEPGWGYEDDDLYIQMVASGWESRYFNRMCYLHRNIRSSWPSLRESGVDVRSTFKARKSYMLNKWKRRGVDSNLLARIDNQSIPVEMDHGR